MHTFTKRVTFTPLSRGRYRCNQTGKVMTQGMILSHVSSILAGGRNAAVGMTPKQQPPSTTRRAKGEKHPSTYRAKHR